MLFRLMGKKKGMTRIFDDKDAAVVCTAIEIAPNYVLQLKSEEVDGYRAAQLGMDELSAAKARKVSKPLQGHFKKAAVNPQRYVAETSYEGELQVGQALDVGVFKEVAFVDVAGVSKGKGYQGVMKRHGHAGGPASHGSGFHRHGGSTGMRTTPGRCLPGVKKAGHMGAENVTVESLRVVKVDVENRLLLVEGAVPGHRGALVYVMKAKKKVAKTTKVKKK